MVTLPEALDVLYAIDPDGFVAQRTELVAQARADADRALVRELQALRRPTRSAWLVNMLARSRGAELAGLLELGPALSRAHTGGSMAELREMSALRRRTLDGLVRLARELARERGHEPTQATLGEVHTILDAALTHPEIGDAVRVGVLTRAPESAAAFPTELFAPLADVVDLPVRDAGAETPDAGTSDDEQAAQLAARLAEAEAAAATAAARQETSADELTDAEAGRAELESLVAELERRLDRGRADLATAQERVAAATAELAAATDAAARAAADLERLRRG